MSQRIEERFSNVLFMQSVFSILHLRSLTKDAFKYPPVFVFPSMEKLLEENDPETERLMFQFSNEIFSHFVGQEFESIEELCEFAALNEEFFLNKIEESHLFVAPGASAELPLNESLPLYIEHISTWRTPEWIAEFQNFPVTSQVIYVIIERLGAQFHLLENAESLDSHPLLSVEQQAHYYKIVSQTNSARLAHLDLLNPKTESLVQGMSTKRMRWLSNVPIDAVVELRKNNENVTFRSRLETIFSRIHETEIGDVDKVVREVLHEIDSALADHERELKEIQSKYQAKHTLTAVASWAELGATILPSIAPFLGTAAPLALAAKYGWDKIEELATKRAKSKSMMGIISSLRN